MNNATRDTKRRLQHFPAPDKTLLSELEQQQADLSEKAVVIHALEVHQALGMYGLKCDVPYNEGSRFGKAYQAAKAMLQELMEAQTFINVCRERKINVADIICVYADGRVSALSSGWKASYNFEQAEIDLTQEINRVPELKSDVRALADLVALTGGAVYSDHRIKVENWLRFHHDLVPTTPEHYSHLLSFLNFRLQPGPALGAFRDLLTTDEDHPFALSHENKASIRDVTRELLGESNVLLESLGRTILRGKTPDYIRNNADTLINQMLSSDIAHEWAREYLDALGWYGARADESVDEEHLHQLLVTAILLDQQPGYEDTGAANRVAGYNLYSPDNVEKPLSVVRLAFENHLITQHNFAGTLAPLFAHLLLAGDAPEFLVKEVPESLLLGSQEWVSFQRGVALAEMNAAGSSRLMTYLQIKQLADIEPVTELLQSIHGLIARDVILDWAQLHSVIDEKDLNDPQKQSAEIALKAFRRDADLLTSAAKTLSTPLPTRRALALGMLQFSVSDTAFLQKEVLYFKEWELENFVREPLAMSMVDLHMSDDLATRKWDVRSGISIYKKYPKLLSELISPSAYFDVHFNHGHDLYKDAVETTLKLAMCSLPALDRFRLQQGEITLFTVRPSVVKQDKRPNLPVHPFLAIAHPDLSILPRHPDPVENQRDKDAATGRYGVVLCSRIEGKLYCYELFTLYGECRENPELAKLIARENLLGTASRLDFNGNITTYTAPTPVYDLPLNIENYTHGVQPAGSATTKAVIEKLGVVPATFEAEHYNSAYQSFYSGQLQAIARFVANHRPVATYNELRNEAWGQTKLEQAIAKRDKIIQTIINIVVPFKACIEDLTSGDADRKLDATTSCSLEVVATLLMVFGAAAKIVGVAASSASAAVKAARLAKATAALVVSALNPLDGAPALLKGGTKLLGKGIWRLSKPGRQLLNTAVEHLRRLTHSTAYDLATVTRRLKSTQAPLLAVGDAGEAALFWATRKNDNWYALNLRTGTPWGPKLTPLQLAKSAVARGWRRLLPVSYAHAYVKKSLPLAQGKIDTALQQMLSAGSSPEVKSVVKCVFGNDSAEAIEHLTEALRKMKKDAEHITLKNINFDTAADGETLASVFPGRAAIWKNGGYAADAQNSKFLTIYTGEMSQYFEATRFDKGRVADGIVHEVSHVTEHTLDMMYSDLSPKNGRPGEIGITGLMNLAKKPRNIVPETIPQADADGLEEFISIKSGLSPLLASSPALLNAESYMLAIALLNQRARNHQRFLSNLVEMESKIFASRGEHIKDAVVVNLSSFGTA